jgi:tetratricopeptide (TPR) repeat protein
VLDQADYLPRLGLGLARIREGDLEEGRREIEIAASLDPNNSLVRSYLGKAYFEEKRSELADREYATAKELDPKDPTPFFYDAIQKHTSNRPVEALQDLEKAIELNDNRAVYRSRLLLDSDLAARSASLARIYGDLGFQQLALVEGWKSVNTDPTNFSAHRFLADSYSVMPRHEVARVSELLQSQLLQPLNMTPIQPRLAESNLFLLNALGPQTLSFNEFNPLFNRDGINFQTTGLGGENDTYAGEGVLSGIYKKAAFSLGGFHFQTDGWRTNADQRDNIGNAFLQFEVSPQTSVQAEVRRRETRIGDIQQRFFPDDFSPGQRQEIDSLTVRLGGRHLISPDSIVLGSFIFQDRKDVITDDAPDSLFRSEIPEDAIGAEIQHRFRQRYFNLTSGIGYFGTNGKLRIQDLFGRSVVGQDVQHANAYMYANVNPFRNVTISAGASFDYLDGDPAAVPGGNLSRLNPKFGITWNLFNGTSIRGAVFRVVKRTLATDQTLEPTQVAGFNQFFDDANLTRAWRYGIGIDQKVSSNAFAGVEYSQRRLDIPTPATEIDGREHRSRAYVFWTPTRSLALRTEYLFERFEDYPPLGPGGRLNTHQVPVGIAYFHSSGFSASLTATYYRQDGKLIPFTTPSLTSVRDDFWLIDPVISYRLPNRYGFVTVGAINVTNQRFKFFDTDNNNPRIQPKRTVFLKVTLALP